MGILDEMIYQSDPPRSIFTAIPYLGKKSRRLDRFGSGGFQSAVEQGTDFQEP